MIVPILIVDGYNIIGAWDELKILKKADLGSARDQLIADLAGFRPWCWERIIIVFDGQSFDWEYVDGVEVVFTESRETADTMIERLAAGYATCTRVEVATSDHAEHRAVTAVGAGVISAMALKERLLEKSENYQRMTDNKKNDGLMLNDFLKDADLDRLKRLRRS